MEASEEVAGPRPEGVRQSEGTQIGFEWSKWVVQASYERENFIELMPSDRQLMARNEGSNFRYTHAKVEASEEVAGPRPEGVRQSEGTQMGLRVEEKGRGLTVLLRPFPGLWTLNSEP